MDETTWDRLRQAALDEVEATLLALPAPLRVKAEAVTVTLEPFPNEEHLRDGIEPDTLGLFLGPDYALEPVSSLPLPPQIILFLENIWDEAGADPKVYAEEVRTTFLHELGHYLGLDEDELWERGLE